MWLHALLFNAQKNIEMLGIFVWAIKNLQETMFGHKLTAYTANVAN